MFNVKILVVAVMKKKNVLLIIEVDKNNFAHKYLLKNNAIKHY